MNLRIGPAEEARGSVIGGLETAAENGAERVET